MLCFNFITGLVLMFLCFFFVVCVVMHVNDCSLTNKKGKEKKGEKEKKNQIKNSVAVKHTV